MDLVLKCVTILVAFIPGELWVGGVSLEKDLSLALREKQALDRFREQVTPLLKTEFMKRDIYLIRFLRARNFDVNAAEQMLKDNLRWRQEKKMDQIHKEDFSDMLRDFPSTMDTYDRMGKPIGVIDLFDWNLREGVIAGRGPRFLRYMDYLMENVTTQVFERQQRGMNVTQWTVLANAESVNMITQGCPMCIPVVLQFISSVENHYAGWLDELIIIEAPRAAYTIFDIVRPFLSPLTRDALKIFGMNKNVWMPYMDARISRGERRSHYGGTKPPVDRH